MVVVIGGGASGLGVAWDLLLRSIPVTVVERDDLGSGTSGRFHGLLHSGARYVVSDLTAARECWDENRILRRVAGAAINPSGGYFVSVDNDGDAYVEDWIQGAAAIQMPAEEIPRDHMLRIFSNLNPSLRRGFRVPDGVLEGFTLLHLLRRNIAAMGGEIITHATVDAVHQRSGRVAAVEIAARDGRHTIPCDAVVNAAGPFAGRVATLFNDEISMQLSRGTMLIFANRRVPYVVNRLAPPGDGDIIVPHGETAILGTTDIPQADPESTRPTRQEAGALLRLGQRLFPDMDRWRVLRAFTGVRPLYAECDTVGVPRYISRDFTVIDHEKRQALSGAFSLVGGKWTTYRLMAERMGDNVARYLKIDRLSTTSITPLRAQVEDPRNSGAILCECEGVSAEQLMALGDVTMDEWRTRTWFAMGPCQGTICAHRGALWAMSSENTATPIGELSQLRKERERGWWPTTWGDNAREWVLNQALRHQTLAEEVLSDE